MRVDNSICANCYKTIKITDRRCKYCGCLQYDEESWKDICEVTRVALMNDRIEKSRQVAQRQANSKQNRKRFKEWSEEELLATGLYPKNECIKMGLIARILGKRK